MTASEALPLRFTTWLAPGHPREVFEVIAGEVSRGLGRSYELSVEPKMSGPLSVEEDRFAGGLSASLSGFVSLLARLDDEGLDVDFFGELRQVGSHRTALAMIEAGDLDAAAIDATVLRAWRRERPDKGAALRSVDVLGPFPVQPVVVRAGAGRVLVDAVAAQLARPELAAALRPFGIVGFGAVTHDDYAGLGPAVARAMAMVPG